MVAEIAVGVALGIGMCALFVQCLRWADSGQHPILGRVGIIFLAFMVISTWIGSHGLPVSLQWIPEAFSAAH